MPRAQYTHDVVAHIGDYTDRQTGERKKRYLTVGKAFTGDTGGISIKLEAVPVGPEWSGWLSLYPPKERGPAPVGVTTPKSTVSQRAATAESAPSTDDESDDLPF